MRNLILISVFSLAIQFSYSFKPYCKILSDFVDTYHVLSNETVTNHEKRCFLKGKYNFFI